ncbi:MAG: VWA domain-containing protein [Cyanobacteria bacterium SBLK]|nr:VWA domain-containing protein [Cyanobacteria bacterium SBLK]
MKASYHLSQSLIPSDRQTLLDCAIDFQSNDSREGKSSRRPLNLSIVLDRSGSMGGTSLRNAIKAANNLLDYLTEEDYLSVVIYDDNISTIVEHQKVRDKAEIQQRINRIRAGGLTNLSGGWLQGCDWVKSQFSAEYLNRVLLLTDGQANKGITQPDVLMNTAREKAEEGIITTTLGFGNYFNEDLLIGMADAAGGNYYYIQSPEDAEDVFRIEIESLVSVAAQNLTVTLNPKNSVKITEILNNYGTQTQGSTLQVFLGDIYGSEKKTLAIALEIPPQSELGEQNLFAVSYEYQAIVDEKIERMTREMTVKASVTSEEEASQVHLNTELLERIGQLRIAKIKDEAVNLADGGKYHRASQKLRETIADLKLKTLQESFEIAEEISQLEHYAQNLEQQRFDRSLRKEMRDQSYQARTRDRTDLKLRGVAAGSANSLEGVSQADGGVLVKCEKISGKLRIRAISEGYNGNLNVQFPRSIRQDGVTYVVEELQLSANGSFYRASGTIKELVKSGQERAAGSVRSAAPTKARNLKSVKSTITLEDLETTDTVGDGVLVQCVKDGKKLRARVVSDGYNPDYNIRFPRNVRKEGELFVVEGIKEASNGGSYIALGKIRRLVQ